MGPGWLADGAANTGAGLDTAPAAEAATSVEVANGAAETAEVGGAADPAGAEV